MENHQIYDITVYYIVYIIIYIYAYLQSSIYVAYKDKHTHNAQNLSTWLEGGDVGTSSRVDIYSKQRESFDP